MATMADAATGNGDLLYCFGNPIRTKRGGSNDVTHFWQHDVDWIGDGLKGAGTITLFNNGNHRRTGETCGKH